MATCLATGCATPPGPTPSRPRIVSTVPDGRLADLRAELRAMVESGELVSIGVGAIEDGDVVWAEAWGWADREAARPATVDTRYGLASLGKSITATAIMGLVETGQLDLETDVADVLGPGALQVQAGSRTPTVRQLLDMTSGIPHGAMTYWTEPYPSEDAMLENRSIVVFEPGTAFHYSNFSIAVADQVIETASGLPFADAVRTRVFAPLGMTDSSVGDDPQLAPPAARYDENGDRYRKLLAMPRSSRQMQASVGDMLAYAAFHLERPFEGQIPAVTDPSLDRMHDERSGVAGAHIALGWGSIDLEDGRRWIISSGNDMGVQSSLTLLREEGVGVIVLTNTSGYQADEIGIRIADVLAPGFLAAATQAIEAHEAKSAPYVPSAEWLGRWEGTVAAKGREIPLTMVFHADGSIRVTYDNGAPQPLDEAMISFGLLTGAFEGRLPLEESASQPHRIETGLRIDGARINGFAVANFETARGKFQIPTYVFLEKADGKTQGEDEPA